MRRQTAQRRPGGRPTRVLSWRATESPRGEGGDAAACTPTSEDQVMGDGAPYPVALGTPQSLTALRASLVTGPFPIGHRDVKRTRTHRGDGRPRSARARGELRSLLPLTPRRANGVLGQLAPKPA
jgi:hypothetical protein